MDPRTLRRRFVWLALLLATELGLLAWAVMPAGLAAVLAFLAFAAAHDWGRVLDRRPRAVNLLRARLTARLFLLTPARGATREVLLELDAPHHLAHARDDGYFTFAGDDARYLALVRAYNALACGRDTAVVIALLAMLALIALPGVRGDGGTLLITVGALWLASLTVTFSGTVGLVCLRRPTPWRLTTAKLATLPQLLLPPFHPLLAASA